MHHGWLSTDYKLEIGSPSFEYSTGWNLDSRPWNFYKKRGWSCGGASEWVGWRNRLWRQGDRRGRHHSTTREQNDDKANRQADWKGPTLFQDVLSSTWSLGESTWPDAVHSICTGGRVLEERARLPQIVRWRPMSPPRGPATEVGGTVVGGDFQFLGRIGKGTSAGGARHPPGKGWVRAVRAVAVSVGSGVLWFRRNPFVIARVLREDRCSWVVTCE